MSFSISLFNAGSATLAGPLGEHYPEKPRPHAAEIPTASGRGRDRLIGRPRRGEPGLLPTYFFGSLQRTSFGYFLQSGGVPGSWSWDCAMITRSFAGTASANPAPAKAARHAASSRDGTFVITLLMT